MSDEVVFEGEKDPMLMRRSSGHQAGKPLMELITPGPKKDGNTDKIVIGILGTVLVASVFIAFNTRPKEIVLLSPLDQPVKTTAQGAN